MHQPGCIKHPVATQLITEPTRRRDTPSKHQRFHSPQRHYSTRVALSLGYRHPGIDPAPLLGLRAGLPGPPDFMGEAQDPGLDGLVLLRNFSPTHFCHSLLRKFRFGAGQIEALHISNIPT
jgi:hypothetical protein